MDNQPWIASVGYEGETPDDFIDKLRRWDVTTVVDVRLNPISRKRGFSKNVLANLLESHGIEYRHMPTLGNPRDNRDGYSDATSEAGLLARDKYKAILEAEATREDLDELSRLASETRIAVMCFEASERHCHRHEVLDAIYQRLDGRVPV